MKKHVIITGAGRGLGRHVAVMLARSKTVASMTLLSKNRTRLDAVVSELKNCGNGIRVHGICADLSNEKGVNRALKALETLDTDFNVLINNASAGTAGPLDEMTCESITSALYLNLTVPLLLIRFFLPYARKGGWGRIINISSISVNHPSAQIIPYVVSKAGLNKLTECIHVSEVAHGITCNTIMPGMMLTDMGKSALRHAYPAYNSTTAKDIEKKVARQFPLNKFTEFSEIYHLIDFLLSRKAAPVSGECIRIASGLL